MSTRLRRGHQPWLMLVLGTACVERLTDDEPEVDSEIATMGPSSATDPGPITTTNVLDSTGPDPTDPDPTTGPGPADFYELSIQPIWDEHCVDACHTPGGEWPLHVLDPGASHGSIVGTMSVEVVGLSLVEPGSPELSYLWHKINGTQLSVGGGGLDMPKIRSDGSMTELSPDQFTLIEQWILEGAPP